MYKVIGNAAPTTLAKAIATAIMEQVFEVKNGHE
ncbi:MAG: DNA cytosine methyltransferase [Christensenellaceae bacterium]|jgi:site-specific DNA-cytosine methylase|nr:DNA cytosine methyltransferase [Christensenellaceae bacterium]